MITVGRNTGSQTVYNQAIFYCDYESDVSDLPTNRGVGSKAIVIETGNVYLLNGQHQWILQPTTGSGGNTDGGDIIYDGGVES
jgi:hypothetical protein